MAVVDVSTITQEQSVSILEANKKVLTETNEGSAMREPVVNIMKLVNEFGRNAKTFKGKSADKYVKKVEIATYKKRIMDQLKRSDTIIQNDKNPVTAYAIRKVIGPIANYPS